MLKVAADQGTYFGTAVPSLRADGANPMPLTLAANEVSGSALAAGFCEKT